MIVYGKIVVYILFFLTIFVYLQDPENGPLEYKLVGGDLPTGVTLDETGGFINGVVPDIERFYTFTIRAINNQTKYADSVFKMEVLCKLSKKCC